MTCLPGYPQRFHNHLEIALTAAFVWGVLSVALSPCHIACIPLIVGFIDGQGNISTSRAFVPFISFRIRHSDHDWYHRTHYRTVGRMIGDIGGYGNYFVAVIFFAVGLNLLGILPLPFMEGGANPNYKRKGVFAAFILGLLIRHRAGSLHLRLYGHHAGRCFQHCLDKNCFCRFPASGLRYRALRGSCFCRYIHGNRSALSPLD